MKHTLLCLALVLLTATGCNQSQPTAPATQTVVKKYQQAAHLSGMVSTNAGSMKSGQLQVTDENGHVITQTAIENGHYQVEIPANTPLPILLKTVPSAGEEQLMTVAIHPSFSKYNINPSSTAIAKAAKAMGGYTSINMTRAGEKSVNMPDSNRTAAGWRGDLTTQYGGWH